MNKKVLIVQDDLSTASYKYVPGYLFDIDCENEEEAFEEAKMKYVGMEFGQLDYLDYFSFEAKYYLDKHPQTLDAEKKIIKMYNEDYSRNKKEDVKFDYCFGFQEIQEAIEGESEEKE